MPYQGFEFVTTHLSCAESVAKLSSTCDFARGICGRGRRSIFTHEGAQRFDDLMSGVNVNRPAGCHKHIKKLNLESLGCVEMFHV
jgi:hypothetical protein